MMPFQPLTFVRAGDFHIHCVAWRSLPYDAFAQAMLGRRCIIPPPMSGFFARRTSWNLATNRYTEALGAHRRAGREVLDLTASNPTTVGFQYREEELLKALASPKALTYLPDPKGLPAARAAIAAYYAERGSSVSPDDLILTTSTSEAYSFVFRLLCDPGETVLVPTPSYPLFDFLAELQDVKLAHYELVYDHGWQIDSHSLQTALARLRAAGERCRALLVVHPNNPTGSYVKLHELEELNRICADNQMALIADEVFLDYLLRDQPPVSFSSNRDVLTFTLSGLSKISGLPQMKVAWVAAGGPDALKGDALKRLEVIADTYLSMNAPVQWAIPAMLEERHGIQRQMLQRIRANLTRAGFAIGGAEIVPSFGRRGRLVRRAARAQHGIGRRVSHPPVARAGSPCAARTLLRFSGRRLSGGQPNYADGCLPHRNPPGPAIS